MLKFATIKLQPKDESGKMKQMTNKNIKLIWMDSTREFGTHFETMYANAARHGTTKTLSWERNHENVNLVEWFDGHPQFIPRTPALQRACVVGCGLGSDAEYLASLGFQVTAFDISASAIEWAKAKSKHNDRIVYECHDVLNLPEHWKYSFDFVYEGYTVQSLPRSIRSQVMQAITLLVKHGTGTLLLVCRFTNESSHSLKKKKVVPGKSVFPLSQSDVLLAEVHGMECVECKLFEDAHDNRRPTQRCVATYRR